MSCEKVKLHLPHLCRPDEDCKKIGNPLIYYVRKKNLLKYEYKTAPEED
jgi:DNA primase large subunit